MNFKKQVSVILFGLILIISSCTSKSNNSTQLASEFSFGIIADCQFSDYPANGTREYAMSDDKLEECVTHLNTMDLEYTIHVGDFIDRNYESFDVVVPIYNNLKMPKYHVLGNHDFVVPGDKRSNVYKKMGMPSRYYEFKIKDWRFVVLDGNDISFHASTEGSKDYQFAENYYKTNKINSPKWNGAVGESQKNWLISVLENATKNQEKVILFCHFPVFPENVHNLWNADELVEIIENYDCVKAYINGHNHEGNFGYKKGVHYLTMKGMVETKETAYGVITLTDKYIQIAGYGREGNKKLQIK
tara:strand:- start:10371 stop:11276 length:906 start_codon:yes stop_codon:yes gene_type:complete